MSWVNVQCDEAGTIDLKCFVGRRNVVKSLSADETLIESRGGAVSIRGITASIGMTILSLSAKTLCSRSPVIARSSWLSLNNRRRPISGVLFVIVTVSIWTLASDRAGAGGVGLPLLADAPAPIILGPLVH